MAHVDMLSSWGPDLAGRLSQPMCSAGRAMYFERPKGVHRPHGGGISLIPGEFLHSGVEADCQTCGWLYR